MARAIVPGYQEAEPSGENLILRFRAVYYGADLPGGDAARLEAVVAATATDAGVVQAVTDAVLAYAAQRGYDVTAARVRVPPLRVGV